MISAWAGAVSDWLSRLPRIAETAIVFDIVVVALVAWVAVAVRRARADRTRRATEARRLAQTLRKRSHRPSESELAALRELLGPLDRDLILQDDDLAWADTAAFDPEPSRTPDRGGEPGDSVEARSLDRYLSAYEAFRRAAEAKILDLGLPQSESSLSESLETLVRRRLRLQVGPRSLSGLLADPWLQSGPAGSLLHPEEEAVGEHLVNGGGETREGDTL